MTCTEARGLLPLDVYGDVDAAQQGPLAEHLDQCPDCRALRAELASIAAALERLPRAASAVDVPAIYRRAANDHTAQLKRWRRVAWLAGAAAVAMFVLLTLRVELRWHAGELVVGWGPSEAAVEIKPGQPFQTPGADFGRVQADIRLVKDLVHALSLELEDRDQRREADVQDLRRDMNAFIAGAEVRFSNAHDELRALYTAHFEMRRKGDLP